jgi:Tfp pilus assembly protein PilN
MFKINLLPKEVLEKRRYEDWYPRVFLIAAVALVLVIALYALFAFQANSMRGELQSIREDSQQYQQTAEKLSIFEKKETQLKQREIVAQAALAGRVNVGEVANDISLVLPDEVWLESLTINQDTGLILAGNTPRSAGQSTDVAYKSVAKALVRLSELPGLYDVWLDSAANVQWSKWAATGGTSTSSGTGTGTGTGNVNVVTFEASGKVVRPPGAGDATSTPTAGASQSTAPSAAAQGAVNSANTGSTQ